MRPRRPGPSSAFPAKPGSTDRQLETLTNGSRLSPGMRSFLAGFARLPSGTQPLPRLLDDRQIGVFCHVDRLADEAELVLLVNIGLQRLEVGQTARIAVVILLGEDPFVVD